MTILIVYATNSSGTLSVGQLITDQLRAAGHDTTLVEAAEADPGQFSKYHLVILGSCTWEKVSPSEHLEGQLHEHMAAFVAKCQGQQFPQQAFAVYGLGDSSYTHFCAAVDHLEAFVKNAGGKLFVPSLRIDGYYFDRDNNDALIQTWAKGIQQALAA